MLNKILLSLTFSVFCAIAANAAVKDFNDLIQASQQEEFVTAERILSANSHSDTAILRAKQNETLSDAGGSKEEFTLALQTR